MHAVNVLFLFFTCEDIGVAIVTKMITIAMVPWSLKKYLDMLLYDRNIIGASSEIFGKSPKNVQKQPYLRNNFGKSSEIFGKWSEIFGKSSETSSLVCLCNKQNITCPLVDMNFIFSCSTRHLTRLLRSLVRYRVEHSKIKFISTCRHVTSSLSFSAVQTHDILYIHLYQTLQS